MNVITTDSISAGAQAAIAIAVRVCFGVAITLAIYAVLSTFIWGWLAAILALIASCPLENAQFMAPAKIAAYNAAIVGAEKLAGWFAGLRAKVQA